MDTSTLKYLIDHMRGLSEDEMIEFIVFYVKSYVYYQLALVELELELLFKPTFGVGTIFWIISFIQVLFLIWIQK